MDLPKWLQVAERELGQHEIRGGENPRIVAYHQTTTLRAREDEVPWCSSFVNWCMLNSGLDGTRSAAARSWLHWGREVETPEMGCVVVMSRGRNPRSGHVAFWVGQLADHVLVLGGNQGDRVQVDAYPLDRVLSYRMPEAA